MRALRSFLLLLPGFLLLGGCTGDSRFDRAADSLHPWSGFGSSRRLLADGRTLAPPDGLTRRRVADDSDRDLRMPTPPTVRPEPGNVWPEAEPRQNTLADFERSLHDGRPPPSPPRNAPP